MISLEIWAPAGVEPTIATAKPNMAHGFLIRTPNRSTLHWLQKRAPTDSKEATRATSGHAAAPLREVMKSRRLIFRISRYRVGSPHPQPAIGAAASLINRPELF